MPFVSGFLIYDELALKNVNRKIRWRKQNKTGKKIVFYFLLSPNQPPTFNNKKKTGDRHVALARIIRPVIKK